MTLNLIKLCVGCDSVEDLLAWRRSTFALKDPWVLRTRQTPRRADELVAGGSLYRVYKGYVLSRQRILKVETVTAGSDQRCEILLDPQLIMTDPTPRRAFQGWRYLSPKDAPPDIGAASCDLAMPAELARRLRDLGAW